MNNNGFAATGSSSTSSSSSTAAFDAFLNVIADSANKTAPAAAAAAAASNVDQNPWTSEPPKRSTNPFRWSAFCEFYGIRMDRCPADVWDRLDAVVSLPSKMAQRYLFETFKAPSGPASPFLPAPARPRPLVPYASVIWWSYGNVILIYLTRYVLKRLSKSYYPSSFFPALK